MGKIDEIPLAGNFGGDAGGFLGESPLAVQVYDLSHDIPPVEFTFSLYHGNQLFKEEEGFSMFSTKYMGSFVAF